MAKKNKTEVNEKDLKKKEKISENLENQEADMDVATENGEENVEEVNEPLEEENTSDNAENASMETEKKDKKDLLIEELNDKYMRTFAEFDNFRKRSEKEKAAMFEVGAKSIVEKILPIVDSFERGLATIPEEKKTEPFAEGMDMVYKQLMKALEEAGVKPIEAVGSEFNPDLHNAVMHIEDENFESNIVAEEFQKGYMYRESVVRHSMVKVAN